MAMAAGDDLVLAAPVSAPVSQGFGSRPAVYRRFGLAGHEGIDYACPVGTAVMAAAGGQVWRAGETLGPWGVRVIVRHGFGFTVYAHLSEARVTTGQLVTAGQVVGLSGATGNVTGPHLHFALARPAVRPGYACPAAMGAHWWHEPVAIDAGATRSVGIEARGMRCGVHGFGTGGDVW